MIDNYNYNIIFIIIRIANLTIYWIGEKLYYLLIIISEDATNAVFSYIPFDYGCQLRGRAKAQGRTGRGNTTVNPFLWVPKSNGM